MSRHDGPAAWIPSKPCETIERLTGRARGVCFPRDGIANTDGTTVEHLRKDAAAPIGFKSGAQAGCRLVHPLAGCQLTTDGDAAGADQENTAACVRQLDPA